MHSTLGRRLVYASLIAYHAMFYAGRVYILQWGMQPQCVILVSLAGIAVAAASAIVVPRTFGFPSRRGNADPQGGAENFRALKTAAPYIVATAFSALNVTWSYLGFSVWGDSEYAYLGPVAGYCLNAPLLFFLFFTRTPEKNRGLWFGLCISAGMVVKIILHSTMLWEMLRIGPGQRLDVLFWLCLVMAAVVGTLAVLAIAATNPAHEREEPAARRPAGNLEKMLARLIAVSALFYFANGLLSIRIFTDVNPQLDPNQALFPYLLPVMPLAGWFMDRNPDLSFGRLMITCSAFFLLGPSLMVLDDSAAAHTVVHALGSAGLFVVFVSMSVAFARLAPPGPWWCLLVCVPFISRFISPPCLVMARLVEGEGKGMLVLLSIIAAGTIYHLTHHLHPFVMPAAEPAPESGEPTDAKKAAPGRQDKAQRPGADDIFLRNNLSAREREVAAELLQGHSTAVISGTLGISESTVNFHVKNILRKYNLGTRLAFVAKMREDMENGGHTESA